jgi:hypothetical protein
MTVGSRAAGSQRGPLSSSLLVLANDDVEQVDVSCGEQANVLDDAESARVNQRVPRPSDPVDLG